MWLGDFWAKLVSPKPATLAAPIPQLRDLPLYEQFQRIGGGATPATVSSYLRMADAGYPQMLIDLFNEQRRKDCHLQGACGTRDEAVALLDLALIVPDKADDREILGTDLCRRAYEDFDNWAEFIKHLTRSYLYGHATAAIRWETTREGWLLPKSAKPISPRQFIFDQGDGRLLYQVSQGSVDGVDLLEENPGRIVQSQRSVVGDVPALEGLMRLLVWPALFRGWDIRDWMALAEIGWKPWRIAKYLRTAKPEDIDSLVEAMERIGQTGAAVLPETAELMVEWPKGSGMSNTSTHREFFDAMGREMSKAILGQTTTMEAGPNGDRASTETRDKVRSDIRESDARAVANTLMRQFFSFVVAVNVGEGVRVPAPWFQTEESVDQLQFAQAVAQLAQAGVRIPVKWVRDEIGMPEPEPDDETIGGSDDESDDDPGEGNQGSPSSEPSEDTDEQDGDDEARSRAIKATTLPAKVQADDGLEYTARVEASAAEAGSRELGPFLASLIAEVQSASGYAEARNAVLEKYKSTAAPRELARLTDAAYVLAQAAGHKAVLDDAVESSTET